MALFYRTLSNEMSRRIEADRKSGRLPQLGFADENAVRRKERESDRATLIRPTFIRDADKIMNSLFFNRYADKTQVFSFYKNDDITRRALHVQLVSKIARNIGAVLNYNCSLIESIALGHDIGHAPFGHAGEKFLDSVLFCVSGRRFFHNLQSVRMMDGVIPYNLTLQTLDGMFSHNGEMERRELIPDPEPTFARFDEKLRLYGAGKLSDNDVSPSTLEGCLVRLCDIIAYIGKDRQDAVRAHIIHSEEVFAKTAAGKYNAELINNMMVDIIENSYGKNGIYLSPEYFEALKTAKSENYQRIYGSENQEKLYRDNISPMFEKLYEKLVSDLRCGRRSSPVFTHHIDFIANTQEKTSYHRDIPYDQEDENLIVCDYIASMTDSYFLDLFSYLFPRSKLKVEHTGYFPKLSYVGLSMMCYRLGNE